MKTKEPLTPERLAEVKHLEELTNTCIVMTCAIGRIVQRLIDDHKAAKIKIPFDERRQWDSIIKAGKYFRCAALSALDKDTMKKFDNAIITTSYLFMELISRCDGDNVRLWKFHNLLHSFPIVYPSLVPTLEEERNAFANVFGFNADGTPIQELK